MQSGIQITCFAASYAVALALEIAGLWVRGTWRRWLVLLVASAGLAAHTWYLGSRAIAAPNAPLASHYDWFLAAAWLVAVIYHASLFYYPRSSLGLLLLPVGLALIGAAQFASTTPLASFQAPWFWGRVHGICLMLGMVGVIFGFLSGVMYLLQSYRLKRKLLPFDRFRLPSLEWLQHVNSRSQGFSALLVGVGFFSGVIGRLSHEGQRGLVPWTDPVVLSLAAMLGWLLASELFRVVYPAARQGRKVAYLTLAAFVFLLVTLTSVTLLDTLHTGGQEIGNRGQEPTQNLPTKPEPQTLQAYPGASLEVSNGRESPSNQAVLGCAINPEPIRRGVLV